MIKSKDEKVQEFLDGIKETDTNKIEALLEMRSIVFDTLAGVSERMMYGGIMFTYKEEDFGGLFVSKNHISFEFSKGVELIDPDKVLEGKGKFRRHLKIRDTEDIKEKKIQFFVEQIA